MSYSKDYSWLLSLFKNNLTRIFNQDISSEIIHKKVLVEIETIIEALKRQNKEFKISEIRFALTRIAGFIFTCNKYNCISNAKRVISFLSHESSIVRNFAASALDYIIWFISKCLDDDDEDPKLLEEIGAGLDSVKEMLQNGTFHSDIAVAIQNIIRCIDSTSWKARGNKIKMADKFVNSMIENFINRLVGNFNNLDKFLNSSEEQTIKTE